MPVVWILVTVLLIAVELHHFAFFAMFGAAGALAATVVAFIAPSAVPLQIAVAAVTAAIGVIIVRPYASRISSRRVPGGVRIRGVHGGLVAARGMTLDEVGLELPGHVRILGESWLAISGHAHAIPPATPVVVIDVTGTTLTVRAADEVEESTT